MSELEIPICPLLSIVKKELAPCILEKCEFWIEENGCCIKEIALTLKQGIEIVRP